MWLINFSVVAGLIESNVKRYILTTNILYFYPQISNLPDTIRDFAYLIS